ncbi:MAG TPA: hypothetical protein VGE21_15935 [Flavobacteriales bacterium]
MERREQYDPEDLEHLLLERSFDELLEEERAYALRHLSGKAEYEAMRTLLLSMADPGMRPPPMDADPVVRDRVLHAFREQRSHRPSFRLNSVKAWFWPENASAFWKPALAFGSLAAVVTLGVLMMQQEPLGPNPVALVKEEQTAPERSADLRADSAVPATTSTAATVEETQGRNAGSAELAELRKEEPVVSAKGAVASDAPASPTAVMDMDLAAAEREEAEDRQVAPTATALMEKESSMGETFSTTHVVPAEELARNMSSANVTLEGARKSEARTADVKFKRLKDKTDAETRSAEVGPELLALLRAAW